MTLCSRYARSNAVGIQCCPASSAKRVISGALDVRFGRGTSNVSRQLPADPVRFCPTLLHFSFCADRRAARSCSRNLHPLLTACVAHMSRIATLDAAIVGEFILIDLGIKVSIVTRKDKNYTEDSLP